MSLNSMLEDYAKIQPAVKKDIDDAVQAQIKSTQSSQQYDYSKIQSHAHTGIDSLKIAFPSIQDASQYRVLRRTTITPAQVLALNGTPVEIVPALGPGVIIIVEAITAYISYKGTAYVSANDLQFRYTDGSGAVVAVAIPNNFLQATASEARQTLGDTGYVASADEPIVAVVPVADPTTGNSPITFLVSYRTVSFIS